MRETEKIVGSDKIAQATGYYTSRRALTRALRRERDKFLSIYGGSEYDPLFWYENDLGDWVAYSQATDAQHRSRSWTLCSTPEFALAFGTMMRQWKERGRPAVIAYRESSAARKRRMAEKTPYIPILSQIREIQENGPPGIVEYDELQTAHDKQLEAEQGYSQSSK